MRNSKLFTKNNNKIIYLIIGVILLASVFTIYFNKLVTADENVNEKLSQIDSNIQRKIDLLPNLVKLLNKYTKHEKDLLVEITNLRSNNKTNFNTINEKQLKTNKIFTNLYATVENYPNLKSSEQFLQLSSQIEGSENRINITRMSYNKSVKKYNSLIKKIPTNIIANILKLKKKDYFKSEKQNIDLDI